MDCSFIAWCDLRQEAQAAWVQAVASIVALGIAVGVPMYQAWSARRRRAAEDVAKARSLALTLLPAIHELGERLNLVWATFDETINEPDPSVRQALSVPLTLRANSDRLHELGPAGAAAQQLLYLVQRADEAYTPWEKSAPTTHEAKELADWLWRATEAVAAAENAIDAMFRHGK
jgi:hypothetical protein